VCLAIRNHVWQGEGLGPATEFILCFLVLFHFLHNFSK
jgi:hypothetical protein